MNSPIRSKEFGNQEESIVEEFLKTLKPSYNRTNIKLTLNLFFQNIRASKKLKDNASIQLKNITLNDVIDFQNKIETRLDSGEIGPSYAKSSLFYIKLFLDFLYEKGTVKLFYKPPNYLRVKKNFEVIESVSCHSGISDFERYLELKNYAFIDQYTKMVKMFIQEVFTKSNEEFSPELLSYEHFTQYEAKLRKRLAIEEISGPTVYQYLKALRLFSEYLYKEDKTDFTYKIPNELTLHSRRVNVHVKVNEIIMLYESIIKNSEHKMRDICIFLLLVETGSRSVEISNLNIDDIKFTERIIVLRSKKSGQRTLQIRKDVIDFINDYIKIRPNYKPDEMENALFLNKVGKRINSDLIYDIFRHRNESVFGEVRYSPRAFRHTFITNALDNGNKIEEVANTVGHKYLATTLYYYFRNVKRIKALAINRDLYEGDLYDH
ncbi:tyrosine-type recombinase/integrase [Pontibacillus yanchengensis]|uniref:Tyr recombinase domain-containing protein n=1 Tax=Pontibacillus yanchengensis Y32 TaxID=1385514 RepID=A0A0A2TDY7_9BACI|nr:site-specific integrase [Pontibacillus yanchengensis]KGP73749.1 hypothetical protein N782_02305 [Pontibacillus yanchengensis Y32]